MIPDFTRHQIADLVLPIDTPLVICDVDEVVVHFTRAFETFLSARQMYLETSSFAINGNIRHCVSNLAVENAVINELIDLFFHQETETLSPIDGAVSALLDLGKSATVVMLTNLPHHAREKRITNLQNLGLPYPVITNSGPKGPAITKLASGRSAPVVFVDDSPGFISSSHEHAPHVHLIHFLQDERFARHLEPFPYVSLTTGTWDTAHPHIRNLLA